MLTANDDRSLHIKNSKNKLFYQTAAHWRTAMCSVIVI